MKVHHGERQRFVARVLFIFFFVLVAVFLAPFSDPLMSLVARNPTLGSVFGIRESEVAATIDDPGKVITGRVEVVESEPVPLVPASSVDHLSGIGLETGIVFSPDFSEPGNRALYEALGFAYFEETSWARAFDSIRAFNTANRDHPIRLLILETHGTEGHGLKLQDSKNPAAARSYVSVGGLQESLEGTGVRMVVISACNAGRLFRPEIYARIDPDTRNHLFLPATEGIVDATDGFDARSSTVRVLRRSESNLEALVHANTSELAPAVRAALGWSSGRSFDTPMRFAVSTMLIQILLQDPQLSFQKNGFVVEISRNDLPTEVIEELFGRFLAYLETVAEESPPSESGS